MKRTFGAVQTHMPPNPTSTPVRLLALSQTTCRLSKWPVSCGSSNRNTQSFPTGARFRIRKTLGDPQPAAVVGREGDRLSDIRLAGEERDLESFGHSQLRRLFHRRQRRFVFGHKSFRRCRGSRCRRGRRNHRFRWRRCRIDGEHYADRNHPSSDEKQTATQIPTRSHTVHFNSLATEDKRKDNRRGRAFRQDTGREAAHRGETVGSPLEPAFTMLAGHDGNGKNWLMPRESRLQLPTIALPISGGCALPLTSSVA